MPTDNSSSGRNRPTQRAVRLAIDALAGPFTAAQLFQRCREFHPGISRATVYRELRKLREEHYIRDIILPHGLHVSVRSDTDGCCIAECEDCGRFGLCAQFPLDRTLADVPIPVIPSHVAIYLKGPCHDRIATGQCPHGISLPPQQTAGTGDYLDES